MPSSTWKNRNIFEDVLSHEDALTDALRNFLKYPPVQDALWRTLPENVQECVDFSSIDAIKTRPSHSRDLGEPDLVLYGSNFILVIEVKVKQDRDLTEDHQQEAYVSWIKKEIRDLQKEMGFVVFLIPDNYISRVQLNSCLKKAKRKLCRSNKYNIRVLAPITWQMFVRELNSQDRPSLNELTREFYDYLYEKFEPVIFSTEEVRLMHSHSKETASGILKLMCIVKKVKANLNCFGSQIEESESPAYGYEFSSEKKIIWFGIWWEFWAKEGFPLCVAIFKKDHSSSKQSEIEFIDFNDDDGEWLVVGYNLPEPDKDCSELIDKIVTDIENLLR